MSNSSNRVNTNIIHIHIAFPLPSTVLYSLPTFKELLFKTEFSFGESRNTYLRFQFILAYSF